MIDCGGLSHKVGDWSNGQELSEYSHQLAAKKRNRQASRFLFYFATVRLDC
jgi:hypothetical protein